MEINKTTDGETMTMTVSGRLDAVTSMQFDSEVAGVAETVKNLVFDFAALDFVSSAGLRVVVNAYKAMKDRGGDVKIAHANDTVRNVFKLTGLSAILTVS